MDSWISWAEISVQAIAAVAAIIAVFKIRELHVLVNSRLTQLLKATGAEQRALGDAEGTERERGRKDA